MVDQAVERFWATTPFGQEACFPVFLPILHGPLRRRRHSHLTVPLLDACVVFRLHLILGLSELLSGTLHEPLCQSFVAP